MKNPKVIKIKNMFAIQYDSYSNYHRKYSEQIFNDMNGDKLLFHRFCDAIHWMGARNEIDKII